MNGEIEVTPIAGACGAEISGVDLAQPLGNEGFATVHQALLDHGVIFFRDQVLTPEQQIAFSRRFGDLRISEQYESLEGYPEIIEIVKEPDSTGIVGNLWHSDESFLPQPALGSLLYMIECPEVGGDTMFANQYAAYEALSPGMREMLSGLNAVYSDASLQQRNAGRALKVKPGSQDRDIYESVHPVVRTHPETGRKSLFVHKPYTIRFENMTEEESKPLLDFLYAHSARPEFTCRFRWRKGSLAFWDNRCLVHYALNDYAGVRRYAHRVTVVGDEPR
ncbi:MAG: TauD/TfdA family dioxygenase [Rickettsiales bacterium]|jgi:taurine dioxygenase